MARRRGRTSLAAIVSSVRAVEPLPVAVVATAPADGGGVEWSGGGSGVLRHGMVCCAVLWWWKLCVFLCHIPIYINLVFAMTDDICQCQTFSFSISASPAAAAVVPAGKDVQVLAPFGLKVTFPKVTALNAHDLRIFSISPPSSCQRHRRQGDGQHMSLTNSMSNIFVVSLILFFMKSIF